MSTIEQNNPRNESAFEWIPVQRKRYDLSTRPWKSNLSLYDQFLSGEEGEGFLMRAETDQLIETLSILTKDWKDAQLIKDVAEYASLVHEGQLRLHPDTPYLHHLLRSAIRAAQLGIAKDNADMIAVMLLHDAPEDHNITKNDMIQYFHTDAQKNGRTIYDIDRITILYEGARALSNHSNGKQLSNRRYHRNIDTANRKYDKLHIKAIKGLDRLDNLNADISAYIRHPVDNRLTLAKQIKKTLDRKFLPAIQILRTYHPAGEVFHNMQASLTLALSCMSEKGLAPERTRTERKLARAGVIYKRK